jgi:hypothetical protein
LVRRVGLSGNESLANQERERTATEVPPPSVITFNTLSPAQGVTDLMLMMGGLLDARAPLDYLRFRLREHKGESSVPNTEPVNLTALQHDGGRQPECLRAR